MRCATTLSFLAIGFAIGCGSSTPHESSEDTNSSALADSTGESVDVASAFGEESSEVTASPLPSGAADLSAGNRAELVVALEQIAADTSACVSGSASLTSAPEVTADCSSIGNGGSYPGGSTLQFNQCALRNGGVLDGSATVALTRALSSGATCGPTASIDVTRDISFTNLSYTSPSDYVLTYRTFHAVVESTHPIGSPPALLTLASISGERTVVDPAGTLVLDHQLTGSGSVALSRSSPITRTANGTFTVVHELLHVTAKTVLTDVERVETCCKPVSGSATVSLSGAAEGRLLSGTFSYGSSCGDIELDGRPLAVAECL